MASAAAIESSASRRVIRRTGVNDPVTALHVSLVVTPPLVLARWCVAGEFVERAANLFVGEIGAGELRHGLLGVVAELGRSALEDVAYVDLARSLGEHHDPFEA